MINMFSGFLKFILMLFLRMFAIAIRRYNCSIAYLFDMETPPNVRTSY